MEIAALNQPYVIEKGEIDGRLVQVSIRAVEGGTLGYEEVREATRLILDHLNRGQGHTVNDLRSHTAENRSSGQAWLTPPPRAIPESAADTLAALVSAYHQGRGSITNEYLAQLAIAYEELVPEGRGVSIMLADALGKPLQTVKGHIMRARREGFLTAAEKGREGGEATLKAREVIAPRSLGK
jgi:hypothetical protein